MPLHGGSHADRRRRAEKAFAGYFNQNKLEIKPGVEILMKPVWDHSTLYEGNFRNFAWWAESGNARDLEIKEDKNGDLSAIMTVTARRFDHDAGTYQTIIDKITFIPVGSDGKTVGGPDIKAFLEDVKANIGKSLQTEDFFRDEER